MLLIVTVKIPKFQSIKHAILKLDGYIIHGGLNACVWSLTELNAIYQHVEMYVVHV